jgi:3'-5' exoribonuclease
MSSQLSPNEKFDRIFLLKGIDEKRTKTGKPYLTMILGTPDGSWDGRVWDMEMSSLPGLFEGDPVRAKGTVQLYQDKVQLIVDDVSKVAGPVDPRDIYPAADSSEEKLRKDFNDLVKSIEDPALKSLMQTMLSDREISEAFFTSPAAITMHHARIGGLAEHSINVCRLAHACVAAAPWLDRDLLTVGALIHDVGKVEEYEVAGDFRYTLEGKFLGHIVQGHCLVKKWISNVPDFPERLALDVLHIILSHHGQLEYGSPKTPATAEALVIHFADDLDAKLDMVKTSGEVPGTEEAFVRGLRRSFQYRNDLQGQGRRAKGGVEWGAVEPPEVESGRAGEREKEPETVKRGTGEAEKEDTYARTRPSTASGQGEEKLEEVKRGKGEEGKKSGQEELF